MNLKHRAIPDWSEWHKAIEVQFNLALAARAGSNPPEQDDIHRFRAALKMIRALLRLAPPSMANEANQLRRSLGKNAQLLSRIRDQYVFFETLQSLSKAKSDQPTALLNRIQAATLVGARVRLSELHHQFKNLAIPEDDPKPLAEAVERCKQRRHRQKPKNWMAASSAEIHAYRSALIVCANQAIFLNATTGHPGKERLAKFMRLRSHLGAFNDLDQFIELAKTKRFAAIIQQNPSLVSVAQKRQTALRQKLEKLV
jgi:CHAD domain-containing protein